jgi:hypothetical protein
MLMMVPMTMTMTGTPVTLIKTTTTAMPGGARAPPPPRHTDPLSPPPLTDPFRRWRRRVEHVQIPVVLLARHLPPVSVSSG